MKKFVNCSNHPSRLWSVMQRETAEKYGEIVDILALEPTAVMCMGEFVVCFRIVQKLKARGIKVLASCSERRATEHVKEDGTVQKETLFVFQGFREY